MARRQSRSYQFNPMASKGTQNNIEKTLVRFVRFSFSPGLIFTRVFLINAFFPKRLPSDWEPSGKKTKICFKAR